MTPQRRLFFRIAILALVLILIGGVIPAILSLNRERAQLLKHLDDIGTTTATTAAMSASNMLAGDDEDGLSALAATIVYQNDVVSEALFLDRKGSIIAHSDPDLEGTSTGRPRLSNSVIVHRIPGMIEVNAPVLVSGEIWGIFRIKILTNVVAEEIRRARNGLLRINGALLFISIIGAAWLARSISKPVEHLSRVANEVAKGNLEIRTGIHKSGELGSLPMAIDEMIEDLSRARQRLLSQSAELEEEKTKAILASKAKSEFLANMSHELRTPLTGILGFAEVLEEDLENEEHQSHLRVIRDCGDHLLDLINNILDLSKIEAEKMTIEEMEFSPAHVIEEVVSLLAPKLEDSDVVFSVNYLGPVPDTIRTDPTKLKQIILNLISNSLKFTKQGSIEIEVSHLLKGSDSYLKIDVVDTGIGMTEEVAQRLFEPFTQADNSTTREYGGTGLGLAISRRMANLLSGDIVISETKLGVGTRFSITIDTGPLNGVPMRQQVYGRTKSSFESNVLDHVEDSSRLLGINVLVADDNGHNRNLVRSLLESAGATVSMADNGKMAIAQALRAEKTKEPFDVILMDMDMRMPQMDGFDAAEILRGRHYPRPIIALTANAMAGDRQRCLDSGCVDYQAKPINRESLLASIEKAVRSKAPA